MRLPVAVLGALVGVTLTVLPVNASAATGPDPLTPTLSASNVLTPAERADLQTVIDAGRPLTYTQTTIKGQQRQVTIYPQKSGRMCRSLERDPAAGTAVERTWTNVRFADQTVYCPGWDAASVREDDTSNGIVMVILGVLTAALGFGLYRFFEWEARTRKERKTRKTVTVPAAAPDQTEAEAEARWSPDPNRPGQYRYWTGTEWARRGPKAKANPVVVIVVVAAALVGLLILGVVGAAVTEVHRETQCRAYNMQHDMDPDTCRRF